MNVGSYIIFLLIIRLSLFSSYSNRLAAEQNVSDLSLFGLITYQPRIYEKDSAFDPLNNSSLPPPLVLMCMIWRL